MYLINKHYPQNHVSNTTRQQEQQTQLNPYAPHFYPNFLTHFQNNYPTTQLQFYPPPQPSPSIVNLVYHHQFLPHYIPTQTMHFYNNNHNIELPTLEATTTNNNNNNNNNTSEEQNPVVNDSSPLSKPKKWRNGRVKGQCSGSGKWVWVKKEVTKHPLALACNYPFGDSTSLMIRNIPVKFSRKELMELLEKHCREENEKMTQTQTSTHNHEPLSAFDFLYLPIDFKNKGALGYAFVNFTSWQGALRLFNSWNGTEWENCPYKTKKIRQISRAKLQGKMLRAHFEKSQFNCETDEYLPVEISPPMNGMNSDETSLITIGARKYQV